MRLDCEKFWYQFHPLRWVLWPFSLFYQGIVGLRRLYLQTFKQEQFPVPVIVVGNLTVGGVGKTPLVIALAKAFQDRGLRVGIVSRGYKAQIKHFPHMVDLRDSPIDVGDEPLLIAKKTNCPVVIAPQRILAVQFLLKKCQSQIIISDDGLQHYAMGRAIEIVVIDGVRGLGNGMCLPIGPLRESPHRLKKADFLVVNGGVWPSAHHMTLEPGKLIHLSSGKEISHDALNGTFAAIAAIGHPQRFFTTLKDMGIIARPYSFPDHHWFTVNDLKLTEKNIVMTEKDAVKCQSFADSNWYYLPVEAKLSDSFWQALWSHEQLKGYV